MNTHGLGPFFCLGAYNMSDSLKRIMKALDGETMHEDVTEERVIRRAEKLGKEYRLFLSYVRDKYGYNFLAEPFEGSPQKPEDCGITGTLKNVVVYERKKK